MLVKNMLEEICRKEGVIDYTQIPLGRYVEFNNLKIKGHEKFDEDETFEEFHLYLNSIFYSRVYRNVTTKILKNAYLNK